VDEGLKGVVYSQEFGLNVRVHSNGFAIGVDFGRIKTYYLTRFLHFELGELKHPRETRQSKDLPSNFTTKVARAYKFGKQNNLYVLRGGVGYKRYFSEKAKRKGVAVGIAYEGGATLGLLKPYYLEIFPLEINTPNPTPISTRYSEEDAALFLDNTRIYGASSWTKGLSELSVVPGLHGRLSLHFDWGAFDEYIKALEVGIMADVFTRKMPIMVEVDNVENKLYFLNVFLNLQFGKRW